MSLRIRLGLLTALAVAIAVVLVSRLAYEAARDRQFEALDTTLRSQAAQISTRAGLFGAFEPGSVNALGTEDTVFQLVDSLGVGVSVRGQAPLPIESVDQAVAAGDAPDTLRTVTVEGEDVRLITVPVVAGGRRLPDRLFPGQVDDGLAGETGTGLALQLGRSTAVIDESLDGLRTSLFWLSAIGVVGAGVAGLAIGRRALRPVSDLTAAAEHVTATNELDARIDVDRTDELGRLADSFNDMLSALKESREQQHRLVNDASHELRTPLTSLRTNIELLQYAEDLPADERRSVIDAAVSELEDLSALVGELVDLATDVREEAQSWERVELAGVVRAAVERQRRRGAQVIETDLDDSVVVGSTPLLDRAVGNLLDNALKWSPEGAAVHVVGRAGRLWVDDQGPGIPPADLARVFDRFFRAGGNQDVSGSGLGLAIVRQIVEAHGGTVFAENRPDGGARVGFTLPTTTASAPTEGAASEPEPS